VLEIGQKIQSEARSEIEKMQREYFLREQLKAIQRELGEGDEQAAEVEELRKKIAAAKMPEEAEKQALKELERLARLPTAAAEYGVIRTYLDWLISMPWAIRTPDNLDISHARRSWTRITMGWRMSKSASWSFWQSKLRLERKDETIQEPIDDIGASGEGHLVLCGSPGVGKTLLGRSIAHAMGRKFVRISLEACGMRLKSRGIAGRILVCPGVFYRHCAELSHAALFLCSMRSIN
jgi:ATP-dependent Lon protease